MKTYGKIITKQKRTQFGMMAVRMKWLGEVFSVLPCAIESKTNLTLSE